MNQNQQQNYYNQPPNQQQNYYANRPSGLRHTAYIVIMIGAIITLILNIMSVLTVIMFTLFALSLTGSPLVLVVAFGMVVPIILIILNAILIAKVRVNLRTNECGPGILVLSFIVGILGVYIVVPLIGAILLACSIGSENNSAKQQLDPDYNQYQQAGYPTQGSNPNQFNQQRPYNQKNNQAQNQRPNRQQQAPYNQQNNNL